MKPVNNTKTGHIFAFEENEFWNIDILIYQYIINIIKAINIYFA